MERNDIPEVPAEWKRGVDYRQELEAARLARSSYLGESDMRNADVRVNPDYPHLFDSQLLGRQLIYLRHRAGDDLDGLSAHAFVNETQGRVILAISGENGAGPLAATMRDGEVLDVLGLPAPQTDHTRAQMERVQQALLPGDAWHPQFGHALDFAREVRDLCDTGVSHRGGRARYRWRARAGDRADLRLGRALVRCARCGQHHRLQRLSRLAG